MPLAAGVSVSSVCVLGNSWKVVMKVIKFRTSIRHQSPVDTAVQSLQAHLGFRQLCLFSERLLCTY